MIRKFLLMVNPKKDVDFLNSTEIKHQFLDRISVTDSGWCDVSSNAIILRENELLLFTVDNQADEIILKLKFGNRLFEHIEGLR